MSEERIGQGALLTQGRNLPREQVILRPAMLLLLAVKFEQVMDAMALAVGQLAQWQ